MPTKIFQNPHRENNVYYGRAWALYSRSSGGICAVFRDELMRYFGVPLFLLVVASVYVRNRRLNARRVHLPS